MGSLKAAQKKADSMEKKRNHAIEYSKSLEAQLKEAVSLLKRLRSSGIGGEINFENWYKDCEDTDTFLNEWR